MEKYLENVKIIEALNTRYATKRFEKRDIDTTELENFVKTVLQLTPTSFGLQAYNFIIAENPETREELRKHSWDQTSVTDADIYIVFAVPTNFNKSFIEKHIKNMQKIRWYDDERSKKIISFMNNKIIETWEELWITSHEEWLTRQAYIALGNLTTALAIAGIDSCAIEWLNPNKYDEILWLKELNLTSKVAIAIWKRTDDDKYQFEKKVRFEQKDLFIKK